MENRIPLMLGAEFTTNDALILRFLLVLFALLALLGVAETGINRITRHKAEALAHERPRRGRALERLVEEPKFLDPSAHRQHPASGRRPR